MKSLKRILSMVLALMMVVSCLPAGTIFASAEETTAQQTLELNARYESGMIFQYGKPWQLHGTGVAGASVTVVLEGTTGQTKTTTVADDGTWNVTMDAVDAGYDEYTVTVTSGEESKTLENVVFGEVWVAGGQSNMHYAVWQITTQEQQTQLKNDLAGLEAAPYIRFYVQTAEHGLEGAQDAPVGAWGNASVWDDVYHCSATAVYFAQALQAQLDMPVGFVVAAVGGTGITSWVDPDVAETYSDYYALVQSKGYDTDTTNTRDYLGGWFNSKVAPWEGYEVSGMLWYQGEHESGGNDALQSLGIEALLESWSKVFDSEGTATATELPLIAIQIAPYATAVSDYSLTENYALNAAMREGVDKVVAKGGTAVAMALYDFYVTVNDIHPKQKPQVGARAADMAMGLVYGAEGIHVSPVAEQVSFGDGMITITFENADNGLAYVQLNETDNYRVLNENHGLDTTDFYVDKLNGFTLWTGSDLVAVDAQIVNGNQVQITVPENTNVAGIYYGYGPEILSANLFNAEGYPAMPFFFANEGYEAQAHQSTLWDIEDDPIAVDIDGTYTNDTRNHSYLSEDKTAGVLGSTALKFELKSNPGHDITNTINFEPQGNGLDGTVTVSSLDDIFWFWVDLDYSTDQYIQLSVNNATLANDSSSVLYTIQANDDGAPVMVEIPYGGSDSVAGIDLKSHSSNGNMSIIKLYDGFSGWIGIPVSLYSGGTAGVSLSVGDTIRKFGLLVRQKSDGVLAEQQVGDSLYLDEFWLTSAGTMPALSDEALLYTDAKDKQERIWSAEHADLTADYDLSACASTNYDTIAPVIAATAGVAGSKALAYVRTTNTNSQTSNFTLKSAVAGFSSVEISETDVLWFWVDSDLTTDRLLHVQLNGSHLNDDYIYTIVNKSGVATIKRLDYDEEGTTSGNGLALIASGGSGGTAAETAYARIRLDTGWSGWIGIPVANFCGNGSTVPSGTVTSVAFRLAGGKGTANETVYFDEFWLTADGLMPALDNAALLYKGDEAFQHSLWDIEDNTATVDIDGTYSNDTRNHSYLSEDETAGVLGSTALKYELKSNPGHDMTNTINFAPQDYGLDDTIAVTSMDDILWYWIDMDYSEDQYFQFSVNGITLANDSTAVVYTIAADENGEPEIVEITHGGKDSVDGVDYLTHSVSGDMGILKLYNGFSGWIGVPISLYSEGTKAIAVGDTVTKFGIVVRQKSDGDLSGQQVGDCVYLDEFWLTSEGKMPALSDEALLYVGDEVSTEDASYQTQLLDFEALTAGDSVGAMQGSTANNYGPASAAVCANAGVSNSQSLVYTIGDAGYNQNQNVQLDSQLAAHTIYAGTDILWFWVDSDLSNDRLLHVQVNGVLLQQESIYTIVDANGVPTIQEVAYVQDHSAVTGMAPVNSNWDLSGTYARIKMSAGWYGWIGIPMSSFDIESGDIQKIQLRVYGDRNKAPIEAGEKVYLDELWLTSEGLMPALTDAELLYTQNTYTVRYVADGTTVAEYSVECGGHVTDVPAVPEKSGYTGRWDSNGKHITADTTISAVYTLYPSVDKWNLILGDDIGVKFYAVILDVENTVVNISVNGETTAIAASEADVDGNYRVFSAKLAAAQMTDTITVAMAVDGETVVTGEYTVQQYANTILNGEYDDETKALVREMLNYGAAAQNYFSYNTDALANDGIEGAGAATVPEAAETAISVSGSVDGISYYGATLVFGSKTAVRFYFNVTGDIGSYTFKVGETAYTPVEKDGRYYIEIADIAPQDLDAAICLTVSDALRVIYSPMNYIVRMSVNGSENLQMLLQALYNYHLAAAAYITNH